MLKTLKNNLHMLPLSLFPKGKRIPALKETEWCVMHNSGGTAAKRRPVLYVAFLFLQKFLEVIKNGMDGT